MFVFSCQTEVPSFPVSVSLAIFDSKTVRIGHGWGRGQGRFLNTEDTVQVKFQLRESRKKLKLEDRGRRIISYPWLYVGVQHKLSFWTGVEARE